MAVTVARCNAGIRSATASRRSQVQARPCRPVTSYVRFVRPTFARPAVFSSAGGCYDSSAMRDMYNEMARQWQQGNISGGVYWPGGGYTFKNGRWSTASPNQSSKPHTSSSAGTPSLPLDVVSAGDFYLLYADVPGLAKSDLSIKLSGPNKEPRVLKISGQRTAPYQQQQQQNEEQGDRTDDSSSSVVQQQRVFGSFGSSWELPADADSEGISAKVSEGVLTVTVPKKKQQPPLPEEDDGQEIFVA